MSYELWDTDSGNLIASFPTEGAASRYVQSLIAKLGRSALSGLSLGEFNERTKRIRRVASGMRLATFADAINPVRSGVVDLTLPGTLAATPTKRQPSNRSKSGRRERV
jgi:hypothetical protein